MTKTIVTAFTVCLLTGMFGTDAKADIVVDAGWYGFCFSGPGGPAVPGCQNSGIGVTGNDITFTATTNVLFKVTDAFDKGDTFTVDINPGALVFNTDSVPTASGTVSDPDTAFADPTYSHGSWLLGPGTYTVDIFANAAPFGGGAGYAEVVTAGTVPEANSILLLMIGMALIGVATKAGRSFPKRAL